ncbi:hypothetical protein SESBI_29340 [Sesbania bispinosa]|nr:hypothetical protein SESBI_29340 [Sesbania bispinosa]
MSFSSLFLSQLGFRPSLLQLSLTLPLLLRPPSSEGGAVNVCSCVRCCLRFPPSLPLFRASLCRAAALTSDCASRSSVVQ